MICKTGPHDTLLHLLYTDIQTYTPGATHLLDAFVADAKVPDTPREEGLYDDDDLGSHNCPRECRLPSLLLPRQKNGDDDVDDDGAACDGGGDDDDAYGDGGDVKVSLLFLLLRPIPHSLVERRHFVPVPTSSPLFVQSRAPCSSPSLLLSHGCCC